MVFPNEVRNKIDLLAEREEQKALKAAFERLSENYRAESSGGKRGAATRTDALAYAAARMPATFAAVSKSLELSLECFGGGIGSILDVGAGTGAGAIAAALLTGCGDIICIERERSMRELGAELCECAGISARWERCDITEGLGKKADLVICSYCLNELPEKQQRSVISGLMNAANKLLVIVEPGTPFSFGNMMKTRRILTDGGFKIAAPCPHENDCPLPGGDWCHFTARAQRSKLHKTLKSADVPYEDEKFCFLAAARSECLPCAARILRKPFIQSGKITLSLCGADGLKTETVTKKCPLFKAARKSECGGEFPPERSVI